MLCWVAAIILTYVLCYQPPVELAALKKANIGVAMGSASASDVAREAADILVSSGSCG